MGYKSPREIREESEVMVEILTQNEVNVFKFMGVTPRINEFLEDGINS